ncbi:GNAT family N-acetyltransferase [Streptococcus pneumoniae]|nr:GNAT family N-acetyltransferase [Streptococcus pneumoniae]
MSLNDQTNRYNWAIVLQSTSQPICRIFVIKLSEENAELEITYEIGKKWWYQGLMTEALKEIIRFLFEDV